MAFEDFGFTPPVIAHRGVPLRAPENTIESFIAARKAGATWIGAGVKLTADGVPILMHDDKLNRTTSGKGPVAEMTWADMQTLDAGSWFDPMFEGASILSLAEFLPFCTESQLRLILELRPSPGRTQATVMVSLIEAAKLWPENIPPPVISSANQDALMVAAQLNPDWPRALVLSGWDNNWTKAVALTEASILVVRDEDLTPERLVSLSLAPLPVLAYTVNDQARAKELWASGIKAVYSDDIGALLKG